MRGLRKTIIEQQPQIKKLKDNLGERGGGGGGGVFSLFFFYL